jgi:hypothetical protein
MDVKYQRKTDTDLQNRYWELLGDVFLKYHYSSRLYNFKANLDKVISILLALTSCSGIAAWSIWNELPTVWSFLIGLTSVIFAVKPFLQDTESRKKLPVYKFELGSMCDKIKHGWLKVQNGELSDTQINDLLLEYDTKLRELESTYFTGGSLPKNFFVSLGAGKERDNELLKLGGVRDESK